MSGPSTHLQFVPAREKPTSTENRLIFVRCAQQSTRRPYPAFCCEMLPSNNIVCKITNKLHCTSNYFTKSNLSVTVSQRHRHLSEEIFYDSLGIGSQIRGGAKSTHTGTRIWLPKFDVIILEAIAYKLMEGSKSAGDPNR